MLSEDDGPSFHLNCSCSLDALLQLQCKKQTKLEARAPHGKVKLGSFRQPRWGPGLKLRCWDTSEKFKKKVMEFK